MLFLLLIEFTWSCRILSLSGGGAHGAFQGGVINKLHDTGHRWDIITGISVGSLNGLMLGMYSADNQTEGVQLIRSVWLNLTKSDVYRINWNPLGDQSILDSTPLNKTVFNIAEKIGGKAKRPIIIGSVNLNTGLLELFGTSDFNSVYRSGSIVMASSAIPVVFPPVLLDGNYYVDGGTYSNELIRPAIQYCLGRGYDRSEIIIDIIVCSAPINNINSSQIKTYGLYSFLSRTYDIVSNVISNHELYTRCTPGQTGYPMYVYKPYAPYPGGLLEFSPRILATTYKIGYNIKQPPIEKYCY